MGRFREVAGVFIVAASGPRSAVDTYNCRHPGGLNEQRAATRRQPCANCACIML